LYEDVHNFHFIDKIIASIMLSLASIYVKVFKARTAINECKLHQSIYTFRLQLYIWKYSKPWKIKII